MAEGSSARFGPYEVFARVGVGGMGEVFRARNAAGDEVALKLIRPDHASDPKYQRMFEAEARIGALLSHRNIVRLVDFGRVEDTLYLAMEFVDGISLARLQAPGQPLPPDSVAFIAAELLAALAYAHSLCDERGQRLNLVHRDVSSANVLVARNGDVKLTDFGVAKVQGFTSLTTTNEVKGKRGYMAPEQIAGAALDARTDLFAVGVLTYKMLCGTPLFGDVSEWMAHGCPLEVEGPFAKVLKRALAVEPAKRYPDALSFAADVRALGFGASAAATLRERVTAVRPAQAQLAALDRLILAELAEQSAARTGSERSIAAPANETVRGRKRVLPSVPSDADDEGTTSISSRVGPGLLARPSTVRLAAAAATLLLGSAIYTLVRAREQKDPTPLAPPASTATVPQDVKPAPAPPPVEPPAPPATPSPAPAAAATPSAHPPTARKAAKPRPTGTGSLTLDTDPWARVYLGNRLLGTTPLANVSVPAGPLRLSLDVRGTGRRKLVTIVVPAGGEKRAVLRLP